MLNWFVAYLNNNGQYSFRCNYFENNRSYFISNNSYNPNDCNDYQRNYNCGNNNIDYNNYYPRNNNGYNNCQYSSNGYNYNFQCNKNGYNNDYNYNCPSDNYNYNYNHKRNNAIEERYDKSLSRRKTRRSKKKFTKNEYNQKAVLGIKKQKAIDAPLSSKEIIPECKNQAKLLKAGKEQIGQELKNQGAQKKTGESTTNQIQKVTMQVAVVSVVGTTRKKQKQNQEGNRKMIAAIPAIKSNLQSESSLEKCNSTAKYNFPIADLCNPELISSLERTFKSEIESLQQKLVEEKSLNLKHADDDFIVAKVYMESNGTIGDDLFEFIRAELVGWIGAYQQEGMDTPIFHDITNNKSNITVVCNNHYAFDCVERCIECITQMKAKGKAKVVSIPLITPSIYCFDAKYEGIASDAALFLSQLNLHKPKLHSDFWVVASHKVCTEERQTSFTFLMDERSALALNFYYSSSFLICMHKVTFRNRGIIREKVMSLQ